MLNAPTIAKNNTRPSFVGGSGWHNTQKMVLKNGNDKWAIAAYPREIQAELPLHTKRLATATALIRIGVGKLEATTNQGIAVIQYQSVEV